MSAHAENSGHDGHAGADAPALLPDDAPIRLPDNPSLQRGFWIGGAACLGAALGISLIRGGNGLQAFMHSYLTSFMFFLTITLGALGFVLVNYIARAGWSVVVRRVAEIMMLNFMVMAILAFPILLYMAMSDSPVKKAGAATHAVAESTAKPAVPLVKPGGLYPWTDGAKVAESHHLAGKTPYLNLPFFAIRVILYFAIWIGLAKLFHGQSVSQDSTGSRRVNKVLEDFSAPSIILFFITITFAAFDFSMSLNPLWYSTMWGVYHLAGSAFGFFATLILALMTLQRFGYLKGIVTTEHYHDIGKFMWGFTFFWSYIAFSQYMLIWYGNIPEETEFFRDRQYLADGVYGPWVYVGLLLLFTHFVFPFPGFMSRHVKRNRATLAFWAIWCLGAHFVDHFWIIMPNLSKQQHSLDRVPFGPADLLCWLGMAGLCVAFFLRNASRVPLVPLRDPRLGESLRFKNF